MNRLLSIDFWVYTACVSAFVGMILMLFGVILDIRLLLVIGMILGIPILLGGVMLLLFVLPIIIWDNYRLKKKARARSENK